MAQKKNPKKRGSVYNCAALNYGTSIDYILQGWQQIWCRRYCMINVIDFLTTAISRNLSFFVHTKHDIFCKKKNSSRRF